MISAFWQLGLLVLKFWLLRISQSFLGTSSPKPPHLSVLICYVGNISRIESRCLTSVIIRVIRIDIGQYFKQWCIVYMQLCIKNESIWLRVSNHALLKVVSCTVLYLVFDMQCTYNDWHPNYLNSVSQHLGCKLLSIVLDTFWSWDSVYLKYAF